MVGYKMDETEKHFMIIHLLWSTLNYSFTEEVTHMWSGFNAYPLARQKINVVKFSRY